MENYSVSISIVTYNNDKYIGDLLDSIYRNTKGVTYSLYIVDNRSTDQTVNIIKERQNAKTVLIQNTKNVGFGAAHNLAIRDIDSKYHFFINPDILIKDDVITRIAKHLDDHEDIGAITPKILYPDGRLQVLPKRNPTFFRVLSRRISLRFLKKYRNEYEMAHMNADDTFDIEFCSGSFLVVRTDLLKEIGGFDERYFMYFEDADMTREICKYARAQYNPQFIVYHHWARAGSKRFKYLCIQVKSMLHYMAKWRKDNKQ